MTSRPLSAEQPPACVSPQQAQADLGHHRLHVLRTGVLDCGLRDRDEAVRADLAFWQWFLTAAEPGETSRRLVMVKGPVDKMWHSYLLHTNLYRDLCHRYAGRFVDHEPQMGFPSDRAIRTTVAQLWARHTTDLSPLLRAWSPTTVTGATALTTDVWRN